MKNLKKILLILMVLMLTNLTVSLGQGIDTNKISIPIVPAKEIVKELLIKDKLEKEVSKKDSTIVILENLNKNKDSIITYRTNQVGAYKDIVSFQTEENRLLLEDIKKKEKKLKWSKFKTTVSQVALVVSLTFLAFKL